MVSKLKSEELLKDFVDELRNDPVLAAKEILRSPFNPQEGLELAPHERIALRGMWEHRWSYNVWGRGSGKTFMNAVFASLSAVLYPGELIVIVGPGFRQAQLVFKEIEKLLSISPLFMDCIKGGGRGIRHNANEYSIEFKNGSVIRAVPLGSDGSKIRGIRAHRLIIDELVQVPPEIINTVILPFMATSKNPMAKYLGLDSEDSGNKLVFSTSAFFTFNHGYERYCTFVKKIYGEKDGNYFLSNFNYKDCPDGFIDLETVELARAQTTEAEFKTEWEAEWVSDTQGFYPASLIETVSSIKVQPQLIGDKGAQYVLGVDPAESYNTCGFCVMKIGDPFEIVNVSTLSNTKYPEICSSIVDYMSKFNIVRIGLDQGAGSAVLTLFREGRPVISQNGRELSLKKLLPIDDDTNESGQRIIQLITGSSQSVTEVNFDMKVCMESKLIRWPKAATSDSGMEKEAIIENIKQMETEFRMVEATQTRVGWYSFNVPEHKNKDRYSAALFALAAARSFAGRDVQLELPIGRWTRSRRLG